MTSEQQEFARGLGGQFGPDLLAEGLVGAQVSELDEALGAVFAFKRLDLVVTIEVVDEIG
jgi:hypothetical protein